jgi:integrase
MPRQVRDSNLESRNARARLRVQHKPYFRLIEPGLHLGYRKLASGPGTWVVRRYSGDGAYVMANLRAAGGALIVADDYDDADGVAVLNFAQAQIAARPKRVRSAEPFTVRKAVEQYLAAKADDGRDIQDARGRFNAHVLPTLGDVECARLTADQIRRWHRALAKATPRRRAGNGDVRARQASANRVWTLLKAALNLGFHHEKIASDAEWRKVKSFKGVEASRSRYLSMTEARRLINAAEPNFRLLIEAALQTGARYGQLAALRVADFNDDAETLRLTTRKGNGSEREHHIFLTDEAAQFFRTVCAGRAGNDVIFKKAGRAWYRSEQERPMAEAVERAKITPKIGFHGLRHTWASHAVMNGVPLLVVAKNLGHADTRMVERHYGHLAPSYIADAIRAGAPKFGIKPERKVVPIEATG